MKLSPFKKTSHKGQAAEQLARRYLERQGLTFISQNFHSRQGEIDLIMQHGQALVFVEVRYRKNSDFGGAVASITPQKQQKLQRAALYYIQKLGHEPNARFDVVAMSGDDNNLEFNWIQNAF